MHLTVFWQAFTTCKYAHIHQWKESETSTACLSGYYDHGFTVNDVSYKGEPEWTQPTLANQWYEHHINISSKISDTYICALYVHKI